MKRYALSIIFFLLTASAAFAQTKSAVYKAPRTSDGVPDLQGVYSNSSEVPLERAANLGTKEFYTDEDLAKRAAATANPAPRAAAQPGTTADIHYDTSQFGLGRNVCAAAATAFWSRGVKARSACCTRPPN